VTDDVDRPTSSDDGTQPPLSRWPVVVFGIVILVASAIWMSCQEYASGIRVPSEGNASEGAHGVEHE
jgi:hypothetical protein